MLEALRLELTPLEIPAESVSNTFQASRDLIARAEWRRIFNRRIRESAGPHEAPIHLTADNLRSNQEWGDTLLEKEPHVLRLYGANVNGFAIDRDGGQFNEFCLAHKEVQADISAIQEHNLDLTQSYVRSVLYRTAQRHWQRSQQTHSCTNIPFATPYKPGGTMLLTTDSVTAKVSGSGADPMGRWAYQTFQGRNTIKVTFITAYQVVDSSAALRGTITAAAQQYRMLALQDDSTRNPRYAFRRDLRAFLDHLLSQGHDIILSGDFNESLGEDPEGMLRLLHECSLVDLFASQHPTLLPPATYARGRSRLDYVLVTARILESIRKSGYEPFGQRIQTDHRAYFVDFDERILFGGQIQQLASYARRGLRTNNLKQVTEYLREKHRLFEAKNIYERSKRLDRPGDRPQFAERLDRDILEACLAAERRTTRYEQSAWSLKLAQARRRVTTLQRILTMYRTKWDMTPQITSLISSMQSSFIYPSTLSECSCRLREAKKEVRAIIKEHFQARDDERNAKITELETSGIPANRTKAKILRNLRKAEEIKRMFQRIRGQRQSITPRGITRIEIPVNEQDDYKTCTNWKVIDVPSEILAHLQRRNRIHFGQAHGTPFTREPFASSVGYRGDTDIAELIHKGEDTDLPTDDDCISLFLQYLRTTPFRLNNPLQTPIAENAFISKLRSWRESTATSPSGLHLGHYRAMVARHSHSNDEDDTTLKDELDQIQANLLQVHLRLINYALLRGYSYQRWQQVVNTMLLKEPGNYRIHRTRVIHIYEADYNLALGLKWREALFESERENTINDGQYGSRPKRNAHDPVFIEILQNEISRASRKSLIQTNYDATSCYDRILPSLSTLASRKFGVPSTVTLMNSATLEKAQYRLRTELGVSDSGYSHCSQYPIYGTGQGSGNSPMVWCFLSSVLFDCYQQRAHGATYECPDRSSPITIHMVGYVDDSNGQTNQFCMDSQPTPEVLCDLMRADAQHWNDILWTSGGELELSKCSYQVLHWMFTPEGAPILRGGQFGPSITLDHATRERRYTLTQLSAHGAHKTLGHYITPSGNQVAQLRHLQRKSDESANFVANSALTRQETWTYYFAVYLNEFYHEFRLFGHQDKVGDLGIYAGHAMSR